MQDLAERAIDAALSAGAGYADARIVQRRAQNVSTKNGEVDSVSDAETEGIGVRVLVDGAWGFAGDPRLSEEGARDAALRAVAFARASASRARTRVELAPVPPASGEYEPKVERDPVEVPLEEKIALCLRAEEGMRRPEVKITEATVRAMREQRVFHSSEGARITQRFVECGGGIDALAVSDDGRVQNRSYPSAHGGSSGQGGWEYVEQLGLDREAPRIGEEAAALLTADACPAGVTTIVIDAEQMELQVHESVGHPTELDRVYGTEAAYAGTSFLKAGDLGSLRYGSEHMNITADPTTPLGLGSFGWDDEGAPARRQPVVESGILTGYLASRETSALIGRDLGGSMRADNWSRMPLVRMTNLHLEPGVRLARGPARGRGRRPLPLHEQELVDRRQAPQLPVRDADRLGDQEGQARADAPRRHLHGCHARVLGPPRRRRRARRVDDVRPHELRQGPAGPARARLARHVSGTLP